MKQKDSILVGVDYSANSENALREAARMANWSDSSLCCLHVMEEEVIDRFRDQEGFDEQAVWQSALTRLEEYVGDTIGAGHQIHCRVEIGHPFVALLEAVNDAKASLLVLGSHGLGKSTSSRVGTFASRCIRKAPVEVMLVRERQTEPFANIVACVDFSENSIRAAYRAAEIAMQDNAALELLHVYRSPISAASAAGGLGPSLPPSDSTAVLADLQGQLEKLGVEISNECGGQPPRAVVIECSGIALGITDRLAEVNSDLAVLGTRGRTGLKGLLIGTTAERLIHDSPCSVLAVKPEGFKYSL